MQAAGYSSSLTKARPCDQSPTICVHYPVAFAALMLRNPSSCSAALTFAEDVSGLSCLSCRLQEQLDRRLTMCVHHSVAPAALTFVEASVGLPYLSCRLQEQLERLKLRKAVMALAPHSQSKCAVYSFDPATAVVPAGCRSSWTA
jgi:hypothetical protein